MSKSPRRVLPAAPVTDADRETFDVRPITLVEKPATGRGKASGFILKARTVEVVGKPAFDQFVNAFELAQAAEESAPYWIGRLMLYAKERGDWKPRLSQVLKATGLAKKTVQNYTTIVSKVPERLLYIAPSPQHAGVVTKLPEERQEEMLDLARTEGLSYRELRQEVAKRSRRKVVEGKAKLEGVFRVGIVDCPWKYRNDAAMPDGSLGKLSAKYDSMTYEQLIAMPVESHFLPDSVIFFWVPATLVYDCMENGIPGPLAVMRAWGFEPVNNFAWDKELGLPGTWNHVTHELLFVATRGKIKPDRGTPQFKSVIRERRSKQHSEKPNDTTIEMVERLVDGPYVYIFGSEPVKGWEVYGNDARLWGGEPEETVPF